MTLRKLQVFVSSTYVDLRAERQAAVTAILENGHIPAGMELFAAGSEEQMEVIKRWIDESDIFLLILGRRYGSLETKSQLSYIQLEYEHAIAQSKSMFAIVLSEKFVDAKVRSGASVDDLVERAQPEKFKAFHTVVTSKLCKFVDDEKDIRLAIAQSIRDLERRHQFVGWVSGTQASADSALVADLGAAAKLAASLQERNLSLEKELQKLREVVSAKETYGGRTFEDLCEILRQEQIRLKLKDDEFVSLDLLTAARRFKNSLASGVSNSASTGDFMRSIYWNVASPLAVYGLTEQGRVPASVHWQRLLLSSSGKRFLSDVEAVSLKRDTSLNPNESDGEIADTSSPSETSSEGNSLRDDDEAKPRREGGSRPTKKASAKKASAKRKR